MVLRTGPITKDVGITIGSNFVFKTDMGYRLKLRIVKFVLINIKEGDGRVVRTLIHCIAFTIVINVLRKFSVLMQSP